MSTWALRNCDGPLFKKIFYGPTKRINLEKNKLTYKTLMKIIAAALQQLLAATRRMNRSLT